MTRIWLICLLFGLCWSPATGFGLASAAQDSDPREAIDSDRNHHPSASNISPDAPVITINGICENSLLDQTATANCRTVITQAEFARLIEAVQPNMPARTRRDFALRYADALAMAKRAEQMGLDKGASYEEQMKLARIQILSNELKKAFQIKASEISNNEIEEYYDKNIVRFEKAEVDRIYLPKSPRARAASRKSPGEAGIQELPPTLDQMKGEADVLWARAVAGEEFSKLQAEADQIAGIKSTAPKAGITIRRTSLPSSQVSVFDLKSGEVSAVFTDPGGYIIFKIRTKETLPLEQCREEIKEILRSQRMQGEIRDVENSASPTLDDSYFLPPSLR